jgi:hypothetical protein
MTEINGRFAIFGSLIRRMGKNFREIQGSFAPARESMPARTPGEKTTAAGGKRMRKAKSF